MTSIDAVLAVAKREIGVREATGKNDGKRVKEYLASVGLGEGYAWCAAFVDFCIEADAGAAAAWRPDNPAYCPSLYVFARRKGILHSSPVRGDVFLYSENGWALHTGFVTGVEASRFSTIEGNTNPGGSAEGDGVYARARPRNGGYAFVRWVDLLPAVAPTVSPTFALVVGGQVVLQMPVKNGRSYVELAAFAKVFDLTLSWDQERHRPRLGWQLVTADVEIRDSRAWARVNELLPRLGIDYVVDMPGRRVVVS